MEEAACECVCVCVCARACVCVRYMSQCVSYANEDTKVCSD